MSERLRNLFATLLLLLLAVSAFVAGYFTNDFLEMRRGEVTVQTEDASEFALFWEAWGRVEDNFFGELVGTEKNVSSEISPETFRTRS